MTKQTLIYDSRQDPLGSFIIVQDGELTDTTKDIYSELRRRVIRNLLAAILPF